MTLKELQRSIDYIRENYDNWGEIPISIELEGMDNQVLVSEVENVFIPDDEDVLVMRNYL
jgi:hypothetical protein